MRDGGKGDSMRPLVVPMSEFDKSWDEIFGKKEEKKPNLEIELEVDNDEQQVTIKKTWEF